MNPRERLLLWVLLVGAWAVPLVRVCRFWLNAWDVYRDHQSVNAWNDVSYAAWLTGGYVFCVIAPVLMLLLVQMTRRLEIMLIAACILVAAYTICRHPEEPVVIIPVMHPMWPVWWTALAVFATWLVWLGERRSAARVGG